MYSDAKTFEEAKKYVKSLGLKSLTEWGNYYKSGKKPPDILADPSKAYKKEWKGWGDWLGIGTIAPSNREFKPFKEAREFVHSLQRERRISTDPERVCIDYTTYNKLKFQKSGAVPTDTSSIDIKCRYYERFY